MISIYAPYWMVNRTELDLSYRVRTGSYTLLLYISVVIYVYLLLLFNNSSYTFYTQTNYYYKHEFKHGRDEEPLLFGYETYGSKIKADIKIATEKGEWGTDAGINLDTVGLAVGYICKVKDDRDYNVSVYHLYNLGF